VAEPNNKFDRSTLSDPELNPLSNPLLAANLGRWAEVYFTSPPDRRTEAVADLLRELETDVIVSQPRKPDEDRLATKNARLAEPMSSSQMNSEAISAEGIWVCSACGHGNPEQRFCGMCGNLLLPEHERMREIASFEQPEGTSAASDSYSGDDVSGRYGDRETPTAVDSADRADYAWGPASGESYEHAYDDLPSFAREPEPVPYRYRLYIGTVLAVLLGGLIYVAKRGDIFSGSQESPAARIVPAAQPAAPVEPAATAAEASTSASPTRPNTAQENGSAPSRQPVETAQQPRARTSAPENAPLPRHSRITTRAAETSSAAATQVSAGAGNGSEELVAAQKYLNANYGGGRDARQAIPLLWNAVAKGNGSATLTLSDLYLRGDGVPQNCDQARLLLDIAAKKGIKGAAERLRHLPAFGCR
jgi:hypothetical protein